MGAGEFSYEDARLVFDTTSEYGWSGPFQQISNPIPPSNPYPAPPGYSNDVFDGSIYWVKQSNEWAKYVSAAPSDSTGTLWFKMTGTQAGRFTLGAGMFMAASYIPGDGEAEYNSDALAGAVTHGGIALFAGGTSAADPGTKLAEAYGTLDFYATADAHDFPFITGDMFQSIAEVVTTGPQDIYVVYEIYGDTPSVINFLGEPQVVLNLAIELKEAWESLATRFADNVLHVDYTVTDGVGPFKIALDWDDGSDVEVLTFERDSSFVTTFSVTHVYESHDYWVAPGPESVTYFLLDDGLTNIVDGDPTDVYFGDVDLGQGLLVQPGGALQLPVPVLLLLGPDSLVVGEVATYVVTDSGLEWGVFDVPEASPPIIGTGVTDIEFDWYWSLKLGDAWGAPDVVTTVATVEELYDVVDVYYASVKVTNSVGWSNRATFGPLTVEPPPVIPNLAGEPRRNDIGFYGKRY